VMEVSTIAHFLKNMFIVLSINYSILLNEISLYYV